MSTDYYPVNIASGIIYIIATGFLYSNLWKVLQVVQKKKSIIMNYYLYVPFSDASIIQPQQLETEENEKNESKKFEPQQSAIQQSTFIPDDVNNPNKPKRILKSPENIIKSQNKQDFQSISYNLSMLKSKSILNKSQINPQQFFQNTTNNINDKMNEIELPDENTYIETKTFAVYFHIYGIFKKNKYHLYLIPKDFILLIAFLYYFLILNIYTIWYNYEENLELSIVNICVITPLIVLFCCLINFRLVYLLYNYLNSHQIVNNQKLATKQFNDEKIEIYNQKYNLMDNGQALKKISQFQKNNIFVELSIIVVMIVNVILFFMGLFLIFSGKNTHYYQVWILFFIAIFYEFLIKFIFCQLFICYLQRKSNKKIKNQIYTEIHNTFKEQELSIIAQKYRQLSMDEKNLQATKDIGFIEENVTEDMIMSLSFRGDSKTINPNKMTYDKKYRKEITIIEEKSLVISQELIELEVEEKNGIWSMCGGNDKDKQSQEIDLSQNKSNNKNEKVKENEDNQNQSNILNDLIQEEDQKQPQSQDLNKQDQLIQKRPDPNDQDIIQNDSPKIKI